MRRSQRRRSPAPLSRTLAFTCALPFLVAGSALAQGANPSSSSRGGEVYAVYCIECHGERGDGQGRIGKTLNPAPRDFEKGDFKFGGTDRDLFDVITHGAKIKGGDPIMASWGDVISERDRWALVAFIRSLKK
jgi:mono/diheme cytochrome c family protein